VIPSRTGLANFNPQEGHISPSGLAWGPHFYIYIYIHRKGGGNSL